MNADTDINDIHVLLKNKETKIDDYYHLLFALGKAQEDRKNFKHSIAAYTKGNSVKSKQVPWDSKNFSKECNDLINFFTKEFFEEFKNVGLDTAKSILELDFEDLTKRTDLEDETINEVLRILKEEFED